MFDSLTDKFQDTFQALRGHKKISPENIEGAISQVRKALLESDVSLKAVKLFTNRVRDKALGEEVVRGVKPDEQFIKIINDSLVEILGGEQVALHDGTKEEPASILLLGLQGAGKTTATAKLGYKLKSEGKKPLLVPCDLQRPAAIKQLQILAQEGEIDFLDFDYEGSDSSGGHKPQVKTLMGVAKLASDYASENEIDHIVYDTAGRLQIDTDLMAELLIFEKKIKPQEKLLVVDSLIGQEAANVAETFNTQIGTTGIILTKLDGDAKGGAALSVVEAIEKPIKLASVGEKLEDLENFYPDRMASRILGMGDVVSLVEKAEQKIDEEEAKKLEAQLMKGQFNFETYIAAQKMMGAIGNMSSLFNMMGMGAMLGQMGIKSKDQEALMEMSEEKTAKLKVAINSMTLKERKEPDLINNSRKKRIAKGSGMNESSITQMIAEFNKMRQMFKQLGPMLKMMQGAQSMMGADATPAPGSASSAPALPGTTETANAPAVGPGANPMDMLGNMMGAAMSKKQQKAMKKMGMGGMPKTKTKKAKKGEKPKIKGFKS